jgi:hypothetical protein
MAAPANIRLNTEYMHFMSSSMNEAKIREDLAALSADNIIAEFETHALTDENAKSFLGLVSRSNHVFFKYPNPKREKLRDELLLKLRFYFRKHCSSEIEDNFDQVVKIIRRVEIGYRNLLALLNKTPFRKEPPATQSSATIELVADQINFTIRRLHNSIRKKKHLTFSDDLIAELDDGTAFSADAAAAGFIDNLGVTLGMLAHENEWVSENGTLVLPPFEKCTDEQIKASEELQVLAMSWRRWERVEQLRRYWGGQFFDLEEGVPATGMPAEVRIYFEFVRSEKDQYDWFANERFKELIAQSHAELVFETSALDNAAGIAGQIKLLPDQFVNLQELTSAAMLSDIMGVDAGDDTTLYAGLRIVEWVRGYTLLSEIAAENRGEDKSPTDRNLIWFREGQLEEKLMNVGLSTSSAKKFIENATLATRSVDIFDCPLIKFSNNETLLFAPATIYLDAGVVTYSNLLSLQENLQSKGKRFETNVFKFFEERGFKPYSIHAVRNRETFEIDVIVPWNEYLFVFECKNRGLSNLHPIRSYYFREERTAFVQQVRRQVTGLIRYPDMSIEVSGIDPTSKTIVPCVLYCLPYSETGPIDGVYISDWYSIGRFFKDKYIKSKQPYEVGRRNRLLHRTAVYSFWSGEEPSPEDLLRQLSDPVQVKIVRSRMRQIESLFLVGQNAFGRTIEYRRESISMKELGKLLGFDSRSVTQGDRKVGKIVSVLNRKFEKRRLIDQTRTFREQLKRKR